MDRQNRVRGWISLTVSGLVHSLLMLWLAAIVWESAASQATERIESAWAPSVAREVLPVLSAELQTPPSSASEGGATGEAGAASATPESFVVNDVFDPLLTDWQPTNRPLNGTARDGARSDVIIPRVGVAGVSRWPNSRELGLSVSPLTSNGGGGAGQGAGNGIGEGFFGAKRPPSATVVFVVDASGSMNTPYPGPTKTRFRRVQFELLKTITAMTPEQSFFVIFFSNETFPMPATALQSAAPAHREPFLRWIGAAAAAGGSPTDPRRALQLGLRLQPDLLYFLTDGEFRGDINRSLRELRQTRTAIHTFAFGETYGEALLKSIAAANNGEYLYVP